MIGERPEVSTRAALAVGILALVCFANTLANGFVYDDLLNILANPWIASAGSLRQIFSSHVVGFEPSLPPAYYRPLINVAYMAVHLAFGKEAWAFHLADVAFHVAASVLAYVVSAEVFSRLAPEASAIRGGPSAPLIAAALFATHPVHTESVAWIAGITDVSSTAFALLSFAAYARARDGRSATALGGALALLAGALLKETALLLVVLLAVYHVLRRRAGSEPAATATPWTIVPWLGAAAAVLAARAWALGGVVPVPRGAVLAAASAAPTLAELFTRYLGKLLWPHPLNAMYAFDPLRGFASTRALVGFAGVAAFAAAAVAARRRPLLVFAGAVILLPLAPALYLHATGEGAFAERYLYFPVLGFGWVAAWLATAIAARGPRWARGCRVAFVALLAVYGAATIARNTVWKDGLSLWSDTVAKSPESAEAREFLCAAQSERGLWADALLSCGRAVELDPARINAQVGLGDARSAGGRFEEAIGPYRAALEKSPDVPGALRGLGVAYASSGRPDLAIAPLERAVAASPDSAEAHNDLGVLLGRLGRTEEAVAHLREAVRLRPGNALFESNLERFGAEAGRPAERRGPPSSVN